MKRCLVTQAYFDANEDLLRSLVSQAGFGNYSPVSEGALLHVPGVDPADLPAADIFTLPTPLQDEGQADYRARIAVEAVGAYNAVKNGPKEVFFMGNEQNLFDCRAATGWPQQVTI